MPNLRPGAERGLRRLSRDLLIATLGLLLGVVTAVGIRAATRSGPEREDAAQPAGPVMAAQPPAPADGAAPPLNATSARPGSAGAALASFLTAHARGDFAAAYRLLDRDGRDSYPTAADWVAAQDDRLQPTGFRLGATRGAPGGAVDVQATVWHQAGVDPFTGLTPGRTNDRWRLRREGGAWRVAPDPVEQVPVLPGEQLATVAVQAWVSQLAACQPAAAARFEAGGDRYGPADLPELPCRNPGRWTAGAATRLDQGADTSAFVAAFGPSVQDWARLVPVRGPGGPGSDSGSGFDVVAAPVGDGWRVLGTTPAAPAG